MDEHLIDEKALDPKQTEVGETWPLLRRALKDFVRPHWKAVSWVLFCTALIGITSALYPVVIKWTFDGLTAKDTSVLYMAPIAVIIATSLKGFASLAQILATNRAVTRIEVQMQNWLFKHLIEADTLRIQKYPPGSLAQRFTGDVAAVREAITRLVTVVFRDIATVIGVFAWMFYADWQLTLAALIIIPFIVGPIITLGQRMRLVARALQREAGRNTQANLEALSSPRLAKLYRLEDLLKERAAGRFEKIRALKLRAADTRSRLAPLLEVAGGVAIAAVLLLVGWRILHGASTVGEFIAFLSALIMAAQPLTTLGNFSVMIQEALASIERFYRLVDVEPSVVEAPDAKPLVLTEGKVALEDVHFHYIEGHPALDGVSIAFEGGKVTALVGRSGSGKSTLFGLLPRLFDVTAGRVTIDGQDIRSVTMNSLRDAIAVVSQDVILYNDSVAANIGFGKPARPARRSRRRPKQRQRAISSVPCRRASIRSWGRVARNSRAASASASPSPALS